MFRSLVQCSQRATWKPVVYSPTLLQRISSTLPGKDLTEPIYTQERGTVILPAFLGRTIHIHNGKQYFACKIYEHMIGKRLGSLAPTCKFNRTKERDDAKSVSEKRGRSYRRTLPPKGTNKIAQKI